MNIDSQANAIQHSGEELSNRARLAAAQCEPKSLRTATRSLAVIASSAGSFHWTPEGRRLLDMSSGVLVANLGHNPIHWTRRLFELMGWSDFAPEPSAPGCFRGAPLTAYNALTELEIEASRRLLRNLQAQPGGKRMQQVMWAASGSEAVQKALWAAMKFRLGRDMIIATRHGFHGKKGLAGAVSGTEADPERDDRVRFIGFPSDQCYDVQRRREPLDLTEIAAELAQFQHEYGARLGCLITEPYLGGGGSFHPQPEYLQLLQQFCRDNDVLFILDEIQSNFGRTGPMYAFTHYGLEPDIVCLGKGLGNGVPVSAAVGRGDVFGVLGFGEGSDTWSANPLASAAVLATLDEFEQGDVLRRGQELSQVLEQGLLELLSTGLVSSVRGEGCVWGVQCRGVGQLSANEVAQECVRVCYLGDEQGLALHLLGPLAGSVLRISPPLTTPLDDAREHLRAMRGLLTRLAEQLSGA